MSSMGQRQSVVDGLLSRILSWHVRVRVIDDNQIASESRIRIPARYNIFRLIRTCTSLYKWKSHRKLKRNLEFFFQEEECLKDPFFFTSRLMCTSASIHSTKRTTKAPTRAPIEDGERYCMCPCGQYVTPSERVIKSAPGWGASISTFRRFHLPFHPVLLSGNYGVSPTLTRTEF